MAGAVLDPRPEASAFPYAFLINGRSAEPLRGWAQLQDLLNLVGMTDGYWLFIMKRGRFGFARACDRLRRAGFEVGSC